TGHTTPATDPTHRSARRPRITPHPIQPIDLLRKSPQHSLTPQLTRRMHQPRLHRELLGQHMKRPHRQMPRNTPIGLIHQPLHLPQQIPIPRELLRSHRQRPPIHQPPVLQLITHQRHQSTRKRPPLHNHQHLTDQRMRTQPRLELRHQLSIRRPLHRRLNPIHRLHRLLPQRQRRSRSHHTPAAAAAKTSSPSPTTSSPAPGRSNATNRPGTSINADCPRNRPTTRKPPSATTSTATPVANHPSRKALREESPSPQYPENTPPPRTNASPSGETHTSRPGNARPTVPGTRSPTALATNTPAASAVPNTCITGTPTPAKKPSIRSDNPPPQHTARCTRLPKTSRTFANDQSYIDRDNRRQAPFFGARSNCTATSTDALNVPSESHP